MKIISWNVNGINMILFIHLKIFQIVFLKTILCFDNDFNITGSINLNFKINSCVYWNCTKWFFIFLVLRIVYYIKHQIPPKLLLYGNNITIIAYNILFNNCILRNYSIIVILSFIWQASITTDFVIETSFSIMWISPTI